MIINRSFVKAWLAGVVGALVIAQAGVVSAQTDVWVASEPGVGYLFEIAPDPVTPGTVYAAGSEGVAKSTDGGASWALLSQSPKPVYSLAIDPQTPTTLYAGTENKVVFKSTDGGATWKRVGRGLGSGWVSALVVDPSAPNTLYATVSRWSDDFLWRGGVYKSVDGGARWRRIGARVFTEWVQELIVAPREPGTLYALVNNKGVFKSVDGGAKWTAINRGLPYCEILAESDGRSYSGEGICTFGIAVDPQVAGTVYAIGSRYLFKSVDGGASWNGVASFGGGRILADPRASNILYAVVFSEQENKLLRSLDGGANWAPFDNGLPAGRYVSMLSVDPNAPQLAYAVISVNDTQAFYRITMSR